MDRVLGPAGEPIPLSVNWFPHRKFNYSCKFCFHTNSSDVTVPLENAKIGLRKLKDAGMKKINISGGEPFLRPDYIGKIIQFCKVELELESTGIICNGSKVTESWLRKYGKYLDVLGVSCDSFDEDTNVAIGRTADGKSGHSYKARVVADWCRSYVIMFKLNTVVNRLNWEEDMNESISDIDPFRWKVFKVLLLDGENTGESTNSIRDARDLTITDAQFASFLARHAEQGARLVPEDNEAMENSYLLLDEEMRFLDCKGGKKVPGRTILDRNVSVTEALREANWETRRLSRGEGSFRGRNRRPTGWNGALRLGFAGEDVR